MWNLKRKKDEQKNKDWQDEAAKKIADKIICFRKLLISRLERFDNSLNAAQRKVIFYISMFIWSCCMFYILGSAIRKPPAPFVLPLYERADIRQRRLFDSILTSNKDKIILQHKKTNNGKK